MRPLAELLAEHPMSAPGGNKDDRGSVLIVGGPEECPGAAILAAEAALRCGAGRVQLAVHPAVAAAVATTVPESYVIAWDPRTDLSAEVKEQAELAAAVVMGPGYSTGIGPAVEALAEAVGTTPLVLDAGALERAPALAAVPTLVLAPNAVEAADLAERPGAEAELAVDLARRFEGAVAVRGGTIVVADATGASWERQPPPGLGTPGSGDVFMGVLGARLASGQRPVAALGWAVAIHVGAGSILARETPVGYLARDLGATVPRALAEIGLVEGEAG
jgi:ADP-dependent NAD(P)H-hydrate dehydratase